jgi:hypothetical protein
MLPAGSTEHRLLQTILRNYDTDARGVDTNDTVTVSIQLLLLRIQGLVSSVTVHGSTDSCVSFVGELFASSDRI